MDDLGPRKEGRRGYKQGMHGNTVRTRLRNEDQIKKTTHQLEAQREAQKRFEETGLRKRQVMENGVIGKKTWGYQPNEWGVLEYGHHFIPDPVVPERKAVVSKGRTGTIVKTPRPKGKKGVRSGAADNLTKNQSDNTSERDTKLNKRYTYLQTGYSDGYHFQSSSSIPTLRTAKKKYLRDDACSTFTPEQNGRFGRKSWQK